MPVSGIETGKKKGEIMGKKKRKGTCGGCGNSPRVLTEIDSGQWVCVTCLREIRGPQRPKHLATPKQITRLRNEGLNVPDDLPKTEYLRLCEKLEAIHRKTYVNHRSANLAGVSHNNRDGTNRQKIIARCSSGEILALKHEENNPVDPNAIAVFRQNGEQVGYLSREDSADVHKNYKLGWQHIAVINKILDDGVRGHWLGVGLSLVYAHQTVDVTIFQKHVADLSKKFREADRER